jgi:hypothetical protein
MYQFYFDASLLCNLFIMFILLCWGSNPGLVCAIAELHP